MGYRIIEEAEYIMETSTLRTESKNPADERQQPHDKITTKEEGKEKGRRLSLEEEGRLRGEKSDSTVWE